MLCVQTAQEAAAAKDAEAAKFRTELESVQSSEQSGAARIAVRLCNEHAVDNTTECPPRHALVAVNVLVLQIAQRCCRCHAMPCL